MLLFVTLPRPAHYAVVRHLTCPDRFDTFSAGIVMLQLTVPQLRTYAAVRNLKQELKASGWDARQWRKSTYPLARKCDFSVLDKQKGKGV
eukprot:773630-Prorocentrum_minimum.AAC.1